MKKKFVAIVVLGLWLLPFPPAWGAKEKSGTARVERREAREIFEETVQKKRHDFLETLKGKTSTEKREAMSAFRQQEVKAKEEFLANQHAENMDFLKKKMGVNPKLTDAEKDELVNFFEKQYAESVNFSDYIHREMMTEFDKMIADAALNQEQRRNLIRRMVTAEKERIRANRAAARRQEEMAQRKRNQPTPMPIPSPMSFNKGIVPPAGREQGR